MAGVSAFAVTMGAHRLYTHRSFKCKEWVKALLVLGQTVAGQVSGKKKKTNYFTAGNQSGKLYFMNLSFSFYDENTDCTCNIDVFFFFAFSRAELPVCVD